MAQSASLTVLSDNHTATRSIKAEHGLSCLVETPGANILFDTGASALFSDNARALKLELFGVESIVVSHGHFDHADGLARALFEAPTASLVLHKGALEPKMTSDHEGHMVHVGMSSDTKKAILKADAEGRVSFIDGPVKLGPNVIVFPVGPRKATPETWPYYLQREDGSFEPDLFADELSMVVLGEKSAALIVGDAHNGIVKCYKMAVELASGKPVTVIAGGSCLDECNIAELHAIANFLQKTNAGIFLGHATGLDGYGVLRHLIGSKVKPMRAGIRIDLDRQFNMDHRFQE